MIKNEELLKFEEFQSTKLHEINKSLNDKLIFKERELLNLESKIEEVNIDTDHFSKSKISLDNDKLSSLIGKQIDSLNDATKNNIKVRLNSFM
jgi:hypothetical protein